MKNTVSSPQQPYQWTGKFRALITESAKQYLKKPQSHPVPAIDSTADSIKIYSGVHSLISDRLFSIQAAAAPRRRHSNCTKPKPTREIAWHDQMWTGGRARRRRSCRQPEPAESSYLCVPFYCVTKLEFIQNTKLK